MPKKKRPELVGIGDTIFATQSKPALPGESLLPPIAGLNVEEIALDAIEPNPYQPRDRVEEDEALRELAASIRERGVLQPIRVRPRDGKYQLIAGERRWRASRLAGLVVIPAVIVEIDDDNMRVEALIENLQREDLNDIERARALRDLKVALGITWDQVADRIGLTKRSVMRIIGLTSLPEDMQNLIAAGKLTEKHGRALLQLRHVPEQQSDLARAAVEQELSGDQTTKLARAAKSDPRVTISNLLTHGDPRVTIEEPNSKPSRRVDTKAPQETAKRLLLELQQSTARLRELSPGIQELASKKALRRSLQDAVDDLYRVTCELQNALGTETM